ncbi:hypothetical protein C0991_009942, partial [Blastosporella zonata]
MAAQLRGAEGYLTGEITQPTPQTTTSQSPTTEWYEKSPSADEWRIRNAWTLALIIYKTKNPIGLGISMSDTAAVAWATLKITYAAVSDLAATAAEGSLRRTYYANGTSFPKHIKDLQTKWKIAAEKGANVKDRHFRAIVIASLPESWDTIVATVQ